MLSRTKKMVGKPMFPSVLLPDKQTSKWTFVFAALLLPLLHTSCDSKSQPLGHERGSCARRPKAGLLSRGNQRLPETQANFLLPAYDLAPSQILLPSAFLYFCPLILSTALRKAEDSGQRDGTIQR